MSMEWAHNGNWHAAAASVGIVSAILSFGALSGGYLTEWKHIAEQHVVFNASLAQLRADQTRDAAEIAVLSKVFDQTTFQLKDIIRKVDDTNLRIQQLQLSLVNKVDRLP